MHFSLIQMMMTIFTKCALIMGMLENSELIAVGNKLVTTVAHESQMIPTLSTTLVPVKIRVKYRESGEPGHVYVTVGDYEFDMTRSSARRRKFRFSIDIRLNENDKEKAQSFKGRGLFVEPEKAEKVFFEMSECFWFGASFNPNQANCLDYVFNFVNGLCDGKPPKKEIWPDNFIEVDKFMMLNHYSNDIKIFGQRHPLSALERSPIELPKMPIKTDQNQKCELKYHRIKMSIKNDVENCSSFILQHVTGHFSKNNVEWWYDLKKRIFVQTLPEKMTKIGKIINLEFVIKAYTCEIEGGLNAKMTFITDFLLKDEMTFKSVMPIKICHSHKLNGEASNLEQLTDHVIHIVI